MMDLEEEENVETDGEVDPEEEEHSYQLD